MRMAEGLGKRGGVSARMCVRIFVFLFVVAGCSGAGAGDGADDPRKEVARLIAQGDKLDEQNRNAEALEFYRRAEALGVADAGLLRRIAKQLAQMMSDVSTAEEKRRLGREAMEYARRAVEKAPNDAMARLSLAIVLGRLAQVERPREKMEYSREVLREAEMAARLDPRLDYAWHVLGRWHYEVALLNPALRTVAEIVYGTLPEASLERAAEYLERAIATGPPRVVHHIELGRIYAAQGRKEEAVEQIRRGLALPSVEKDDEESKERGRRVLERLGENAWLRLITGCSTC